MPGAELLAALLLTVLLAWAMNGGPLAPVHGAPLRVVVPGYIGARSVKWLERIELRSEPWSGYYQHVVYRLVPADETPGPGVGMPLGLVALNSDVLSPRDGETITAGSVDVCGYAFAGGDRHVARVDVSTDGGASFTYRGDVAKFGAAYSGSANLALARKGGGFLTWQDGNGLEVADLAPIAKPKRKHTRR